MPVCPFCKTSLNDKDTCCKSCGYSFILPLPPPHSPHKKLYLVLSISSILLGITACVFTFFPALYYGSLPFFIGAMVSAGVSLEKTWGKSDTCSIRILAILGLLFGVLGYIFFMFIHSNVPGIGYSM